MFRKADGSKSFSLFRLIDNTLPTMKHDSAKDPGHMSLTQKDSFYIHQLRFSPSNPCALTPESLLSSQILDTEHLSRKAFDKLKKNGVLTSTSEIDTTRIDANFTHQLSFIPAYRQKQIIDLLFWWEEECHRLRKLQVEREELRELVDGSEGPDKAMYQQLLDRIEGKIATKPSQRIEAVEKDEDALIVGWKSGKLPAERKWKQGQSWQMGQSQGMEALP